MPDNGAIHAKAIELCKHAIRMTTAAGSGHPSTAQALAHIIVELMYQQMRYDPADPWNPANDRLVLSVGHAVPIVYAAYADLGGATGTDRRTAQKLTPDHLTGLREQHSPLDGHPNPAEGFPFFDAATGSLGQGLSVAAGLAAAARGDGSGRRVYCIAGDGESREGQVWEALDFIVEHSLTNLCTIFSCNGHGQAGPVSTQQSVATLRSKLDAFGMEVIEVDGHAPDELARAFDRFSNAQRPLAILARTVKGWGVPLMLGSNYHGKPVPVDQLDTALAQLDDTARTIGASGASLPRPAAPLRAGGASAAPPGAIRPVDFEQALQRVGLGDALAKRKLATRVAYGAALVALGDADPRIVSLDGDVSNSTYAHYFARLHPDRFFECKIAEQHMVSAAAGLAAAGKIPFASSFAKFLARATDQIDMAVISRANIKLVGSHAGVSLAADGPSQMSVSDMAYYRSLAHVDAGRNRYGCVTFHPAEAVSAYRLCVLAANLQGPCFLRTHRPDAPFLYSFDEEFTLRGCKQLRSGRRLTLVSSGFMLHTVLAAADELARQGIECNVFDAYTLPLDAAPILHAARDSGSGILVVEDNYAGGIHAELAEAAAIDGDVRVIGLNAVRIPKSARTAEEVFAYVGIGLEQIVHRARTLAG